MNHPRGLTHIALFISLALFATGRAAAQPTPALPMAAAVPSMTKTASQVIARGQHYKVMQAVRRIVTASGKSLVITNRYTVVANGLNFQDANGNWIESHPIVQSYAGGIACVGASYSVILATNLNTAGAVDLETSDGQRLISNPLGLGFYDPDTGKSVVLAQVKDCGAVVSSNHILYPDAFTGLKASVEYVYDIGHFHQNITLLTAPSAQPSDYGMGSRTRLEMLSELLQGPTPVTTTHVLTSVINPAQRAAMVSPDLLDQTLKFGSMAMGLGRAYPVGGMTTNQPGMTVPKQLINQSGRNILIESVPWATASALLSKPQQSASLGSPSGKPGLTRDLPEARLAKTGTNFTARLAQVTKSSPVKLAVNSIGGAKLPLSRNSGFTLDYDLVESCTDFDFYEGGTFLVVGNLSLDGTTTIDDSVVLKYADFAKLTINGTILNPGNTPSIAALLMTSLDDDSVGDIIDGSTGNPSVDYSGAPALDLEYLDYDTTFAELDFNYCYGGLWVDNSPGRTVSVGPANYINVPGGNSIGNVSLVRFASIYVCNSTGMTSSNDYQAGNVAVGLFTDCHDVNHNGIPDSWEYANFGSLQPGTGDYDSDGVDNYQEWLNGTDPNTIQFHLGFTNLSVNGNTAQGLIQVFSGVPASMTVVVSNGIITNFSGLTWQPYSPTISIPLGTNDGMYNVYVGLRGLQTYSQQAWEPGLLFRDTVAPVIVITNPVLSTASVTNVTSQPIIQLQGYCPEALGDIRYGVINSAGAVTNQIGLVNQVDVDDVTLQPSTNYFECPDIALVSGTNTVTLRLTDAAGNVTTTNLLFNLNYASDTNPPVLTLYWPQNGGRVTGSQFTLRGMLDDPTATVTARIVSPSGTTNTVAGLVELNGLLWVENLPLSVGTNSVLLTMTDAAGNVSTTNLNVIGDSMNLTINTPPLNQLFGSTTVTGTIDSTNYTVWVNGVRFTSYVPNGLGAWTWTANNVPIPAGGTAVIQALAIPNSDNGGNGSGAPNPPANPPSASAKADEDDPELPAVYYTDSGRLDTKIDQFWSTAPGGLPAGQYAWWETNRWTNSLAWLNLGASSNSGWGNFGHFFRDYDASNVETDDCQTNSIVWQPESPLYNNLPALYGSDAITSCNSGATNVTTGAPPVLWEFWGQHDMTIVSTPPVLTQTFQDQVEDVRVVLRTGGKKLPNRRGNLFYFSAWVNQMMPPNRAREYWTNQYVTGGNILISRMPLSATTDPTVNELYFALPDNDHLEITPKARVPNYDFWEQATKLLLTTQTVATTPTNRDRTTIAVSEQVTLTFNPAPAAPISWSTSAGTLSSTNGYTTTLTAPTNTVSKLTVTATVAGQSVGRSFNVVTSL
jgi:hypothetical protein